jgi:hypothetical protein
MPNRKSLPMSEPNIHAKRAVVVALLGAIGAFAVATVVFLLAGKPLGWPLGPWVNFILIGVGALFIGLSIKGFLDPRSVKVGGHRNTFGRVSGGTAASPNQGRLFGAVMLLIGIVLTLTAIFMGGCFSFGVSESLSEDVSMGS